MKIKQFICSDCMVWVQGPRCQKHQRGPKAGESIAYHTENGGTLYTVFRPPKPRGMTPVAYYRKHGCTPSDFVSKFNERYYCNPAHCSLSWKIKANRDEHLDRAYAILN